ncbi:hypothetical protein FOZ63_009723, partial [Perkinsus olseni]
MVTSRFSFLRMSGSFQETSRATKLCRYIMFIANPQQPGNSSSSRLVRSIIGESSREDEPSAEQIGFMESPLLVDTPPMSPEAYLRGDEDEGSIDGMNRYYSAVISVSSIKGSSVVYRDHECCSSAAADARQGLQSFCVSAKPKLL